MTVRWKPLLILSGLFLVIAVLGVIAIAFTLMPRSTVKSCVWPAPSVPLGGTRNAQIHYLRALQRETKSAAIHEEMAGLFAEWAERAPADKKEEIRKLRLVSLTEAAVWQDSDGAASC